MVKCYWTPEPVAERIHIPRLLHARGSTGKIHIRVTTGKIHIRVTTGKIHIHI